MNLKNKFEVKGNTIFIMGEGWDRVATTTYRADYYDELSSHVWHLDDNHYPVNAALGGGLHRYIMRKWYGDKTVKDFTDRGFIVDHINNRHNDCEITNLEFYLKDYNTSKGQQLDKDVLKMQDHIALCVFKDFNTNCYQITIGCNDTVCCKWNGRERYVQNFKLLYNCSDVEVDYPIVINDAEGLLLSYMKDGAAGIDFRKTYACDVRVYLAPDIELTETEKKQPMVQRGNQLFLVMGNGQNKIVSAHYDPNWYPPKERHGDVSITYCDMKIDCQPNGCS